MASGCHAVGSRDAALYSIPEQRCPNTLWLRQDGTFLHVILYGQDSPSLHESIAYGKWKRVGSQFTFDGVGSDWNVIEGRGWVQQVEYSKTWRIPLSHHHVFDYKEAGQNLILTLGGPPPHYGSAAPMTLEPIETPTVTNRPTDDQIRSAQDLGVGGGP